MLRGSPRASLTCGTHLQYDLIALYFLTGLYCSGMLISICQINEETRSEIGYILSISNAFLYFLSFFFLEN